MDYHIIWICDWNSAAHLRRQHLATVKWRQFRTNAENSETGFYSKTNKMHQSIKFILFWNDNLHVSDGLSVHLQEFKTLYTTTGMCQTDNAVCLLATGICQSKQTAISVWHTHVAVCTVLNSWWWTERPSETCTVSFQNKINLIHWRILLVLLYNILRCTALWTSKA